MLYSRFDFASCAVGERIYVAGGLSFEADTSDSLRATEKVEYYTVSTNQWTSVGNMPTPRESFGLVLVNDRIYAVGGDEAQSVIWIDSMFTLNEWSGPVINLPTELPCHGVFVLGGDIYVVGDDYGDEAMFVKLRLEDFTLVDLSSKPSSPWLSQVVRVVLIKNRPCENESFRSSEGSRSVRCTYNG